MDKRSIIPAFPTGIEMCEVHIQRSSDIHIPTDRNSGREHPNLRKVRQTNLLSGVSICHFMTSGFGRTIYKLDIMAKNKKQMDMSDKKNILIDGDYIPVNELEQYVQVLETYNLSLSDEERMLKSIERKKEQMQKKHVILKLLEKAYSMPEEFWNDEENAKSYLQAYKEKLTRWVTMMHNIKDEVLDGIFHEYLDGGEKDGHLKAVLEMVTEKAYSLPIEFWDDENNATRYLRNYKEELISQYVI